MVVTKVVGMPELKFLHFDLSQELNDAASICKLDIQQHFKEHKRIDTEGPLKPLAPSTIYAKLHAGGKGLAVRLERAKLRKEMKERKAREEASKPTVPAPAGLFPVKPKAPKKPRVKKAKKKRRRYTDAEAARVRKHAHDPLIATENLMFNQKLGKATPSRQEATVQIGPTRETIYSYHDDTRPVFGISDGVDKKIDQLIELRIDRILRKVFND